ncbi:LicD family protein [Chloroflexota bacterium]
MTNNKTMKEEALINLLQGIKEILDKHGIEFWLECGTLLGALRNGKFIPWDDDIDIGAWRNDFTDSVRSSVAKELYEKGLGRVMNHIDNIFIGKEGGLCDASIGLYRLENDKAILFFHPESFLRKWLYQSWSILSLPAYHGVTKIGPVLKRLRSLVAVYTIRAIPSFLRLRIAKIVELIYNKVRVTHVWWQVPSSYFRNLSTVSLYGMEFKAPAKAEEYLVYKYGEGWRIPNEYFYDGALFRGNYPVGVAAKRQEHHLNGYVQDST